MSHASVQEALLDDERTAAVETHVRGCATCRDFGNRLDLLRSAAASGRDVLAPGAPIDLADRVLAAVRAQGGVGAGAGGVVDGDGGGGGDGGQGRGRGPRRGRADGGAVVVAAADPGRGSAGEPARPAAHRRPWLTDAARRSLTRSAAVAAAALLVAGTLAVLSRPRSENHDVLLASAERTEAAGSARLTVEGEAELVVPVEESSPDGGGVARPSTPAFEAFPPEVRRHMEQQWARAMAQFEQQLAAFEAQVDEAIRRGQEQIDRALRDAFDNFGQGGGEGAPRAPRAPGGAPPEQGQRRTTPTGPAGPRPPAPPRQLSLRLAITAGGEVDFRGRANLEGAVRSAVPAAGLEAASAAFAVSVDGGSAAVRGADGSWARSEAAAGAGPLGSVLLEPGAVGRILRGAEGKVDRLGEAVVDGVRVQRYRFDVEPEALVQADLADQEWQAEAAVDDEGRVRTLRLQSQGGLDDSPLDWRSDVTLRLRDFGAAVGARPAAAAQATATVAPSAQSSLLVHPFGPSLAASLQSASSK